MTTWKNLHKFIINHTTWNHIYNMENILNFFCFTIYFRDGEMKRNTFLTRKLRMLKDPLNIFLMVNVERVLWEVFMALKFFMEISTFR